MIEPMRPADPDQARRKEPVWTATAVAVFVAGLLCGFLFPHVPLTWVLVGAALVALAILGVRRLRRHDTPGS